MNVVSEEEAIAKLLAGGVGVFPTDTVYGLAAKASDVNAVQRMYALKQREHKPGTLIAANTEQLISLGIDPAYLANSKQWWPNPLSVIIPAGDSLEYLHQGLDSLAIRVPADGGLRNILEQTGPLVTSSANQPGEPVSNTVDQAYEAFGDQVDFYLDGGDLSDREPSTIVRVTDVGYEILRQGAVVFPAYDQHSGDCPFCLSDSKPAPGEIVFQSNNAYVIEPSTRCDTWLVVPKRHIETLVDLPDSWWADIKDAISWAPNLGSAYNVSVNYGKAAGQSIGHLHFWLLPRKEGTRSSGMGLAKLIDTLDVA